MLVPYILLTLRSLGYLSGLGPNPVETIIHGTGLWGIRFLMLTLLVTPIAYYTGIRTIAKLGKPVGLMAFFYVLNHFLSYAMIDQAGDIGVIITDISETPYLIVGWGGFLCLFGVASVSFKRLEKLAYFIIIIGALSNILDRIINSYVVDFISLHYDNFYWPAFNFADIYITIGIIMLIISFFIKSKKQ